MFALESLRGLVVIDEIQLRPELFPALRVLVDRVDLAARFLILGSASRDLIRQGAETLAGRIGFVEVPPFGLPETPQIERLWMRGGFPLSFLAETDADSWRWRGNYTKTFLERDIPALGIQIPAASLRRFWMMLAHYHGQNFNASEIGKSLGVADTTVKRYLDVLTGTFMIRLLSPWFENLGKRHGFEVKFTDHPKVTASQKLALESLRLDRLDIICPGDASYPLTEKIHVTGLARVADLFALG